jgi:hypothetical protein
MMGGTCKLHGEYHQEECYGCQYYFWEQEAKALKNVLFSIRDCVLEQIPDEQVIENVQKILKSVDVS